MTALTSSRRSEWLVPALLMLLSVVPAVAGTARLVELATDTVSLASARFAHAPLPVVVHIVSVIPYSVLGALQFAPAFRKNHGSWHRVSGRFLVVSGALAALTGLWMAHFYPWPENDGVAVYVLRLIFGSAMAVSLALAVNAIRRRDFRVHGAWMTRAYAIGLGAGTQVITHAPYFLLMGQPDEGARAVLMGAGWVINLLVAEWSLRAGVTHA